MNPDTSPLPLVTVVITYHNEGELVRRAVESVRSQEYAGQIEIVLVDDASSDRADRYVPPAADLRIVRNASNLRASRARNVGIEQAAGEYICFLDADDVYLPGRIAPQADFLACHGNVALVGSGGIVERDGKSWQWQLPLVQHLFGRAPDAPTVLPPRTADDIFLYYLYHTCGFMARTDVVRAAGGFRAEYGWGEEWDLQLRIAQRHKIAFLPAAVYRYLFREGGVCHTNNADKFLRMAAMYGDWRRLRPLPPQHRRVLRRRERNELLLAAQYQLENEGRYASAWATVVRALRCGPSIWGLRSLTRTSLYLAFAPLMAKSDRTSGASAGPVVKASGTL